MSTPFFATPADAKDFKDPSSYAKWSAWISSQMDGFIYNPSNPNICSTDAGVENRYPSVKSQYYNPATAGVNVPDTTTDTPVTWNGFPKRIAAAYPPGTDALYAAAESPHTPNQDPVFLKFYLPTGYDNDLMRVQDEYLEWFPTKDPTTQKLTKVIFTCEGPEYFDFMYQNEPDTLLALYRQYVSQDVQLTDLQWPADSGHTGYNPYNDWNTTKGIMHLNCPPNSLSSEINLAAFATVQHVDGSGNRITDPIALIQCAKYGNAHRNSDPNIGVAVNALCGAGEMVTCTNPVGLYIQTWDTSSFYRNGAPIPQSEIDQIVTIERGYAAATPDAVGRVLRLKFEVPAALGYSLSDISVGIKALAWGGQLAEHITMNLSATHGKGPVAAQPAQVCMSSTCPTPSALKVVATKILGVFCPVNESSDKQDKDKIKTR